MKNVVFKTEKNILTITVDLTVKGEPSASGKTLVIGSTQGNIKVEGTEVVVGLNVYKPR